MCRSPQIGIPLEPAMDDILSESLFSCFENGCDDNVMMTDYGISLKELNRFQSSTERHRVRALNQISKYMNRHLGGLMTGFLNADSEGVKALCGEILELAHLPAAQQPKNQRETGLFLAAINSGLMEAVDAVAIDYLIQAGNALMDRAL